MTIFPSTLTPHTGKAPEDLGHADRERNGAARAPGELFAHFPRKQIEIDSVQAQLAKHVRGAVDGEIVAGMK